MLQNKNVGDWQGHNKSQKFTLKSFSLLVHKFEASVLDPLGIARTCGQYGIPLATCHVNAAIT